MKVTQVFEQNFEALNKGVRYIINSGSSRSSKTHSIIQLFYVYAYSHPNIKLSVFRDTKKICKDTVFEDMKKIYPTMPGYDNVVLNVTESIFKFPTGSTIHIEGTDDPVKVHGYHCDILWFNEGYQIQKDTFDQLDMRCSISVLIDLNPRENHWSDDLTKASNAQLIHSTWRMNPFVPVEQKRKILSYQPVSESTVVKEKLLTESEAFQYNIAENPLCFSPKQLNELIRCLENHNKNTADLFNYMVYSEGTKAERPNRIFRWQEIPDHVYHALDAKEYTASDWGSVDPWAIVDGKYHDGCLYFHERNYASENIVREKLTATERQQMAGDEEGIVTWMFNKLGIPKNRDVICDTNRPIKIAALRRSGWNNAKPALKVANSILDGIDLLNSLKAVYFTTSSTNLAYEQENYSREVDRSGTVLETPQDIDNHTIDGCRYIGMYLKSLGIIKQV